MKNILLTGGGGGIARAIAALLADEPYRLLLTTRAVDALVSFCEENKIPAEVFITFRNYASTLKHIHDYLR